MSVLWFHRLPYILMWRVRGLIMAFSLSEERPLGQREPPSVWYKFRWKNPGTGSWFVTSETSHPTKFHKNSWATSWVVSNFVELCPSRSEKIPLKIPISTFCIQIITEVQSSGACHISYPSINSSIVFVVILQTDRQTDRQSRPSVFLQDSSNVTSLLDVMNELEGMCTAWRCKLAPSVPTFSCNQCLKLFNLKYGVRAIMKHRKQHRSHLRGH